MPIKSCVIHTIDKKPDGNPAILHLRDTELPQSDVLENLLSDFNDAYNGKQSKGWGLFHAESGAYPFSAYFEGKIDFIQFSRDAVEHLTRLMEESNLSVGGHAMFVHYQQGLTDYLAVALLHQSTGVSLDQDMNVVAAPHLDFGHVHLAARINVSEWQSNPASIQYVSFLRAKQGRRVSEYFRDFIGCQEGVDSAGATRTLLKAFSDFVESEDLPEESAREKTQTLVQYASSQAKNGQAVGLSELSELLDEDRPQAFIEHLRTQDFGLSEEFPACKKVLNKFRRFTGRAEGLSISFEQQLLGNKLEFDEQNGTLLIRNLPTQLLEQLKRATEA
ncbi:nucleoid-associated protein YejK [Pseudomonas fluorescens]|uniref:Nucleoid-associated protein YejK n=1 Tax=Pseudomonas fluorescens TaxID=294 RepID=A0A5E7MZV2_PSEFL|nr:nucleoid-associated protein YejK [Pseudomonas fluorescens]VVP30199.1 Nucleoid-associated protein YejK [Pseudomonas fluorescens]